jgi:hypothetical protein
MTPEDLQKSVLLITSTDPQISRFGTGFVVKSRGGTAHLLTCAHVIRDVGGSEKVQVERRKAIVIAIGDDGLDIAVLRVEGLGRREELKLGEVGKPNSEFLTAGFKLHGDGKILKFLRGKLGNQQPWIPDKLGKRVMVWELELNEESSLQPGYSGAPIVEEGSNRVVAMAIHREGEKKGLGIDIKELDKIWQYVDREQLYRKLCNLGYEQQVRKFRGLVRTQDIAALRIYGPPEHGQRWLLHRLLNHNLPGMEISKKVSVDLSRRGISANTNVLGREFRSHFGLASTATLEGAAKAVYQCWQTMNVILIFDRVDWIGEENVRKLLEDFWQPLVERIEATIEGKSEVSSKIFMFLIDYQEKTGNLASVFQIPQLDRFTEDELRDWIEDEREKLPPKLIKELNEQVTDIIENSEGGIPEFTLDEICECCGYNWFEESKMWLRD